MIYILIGAYPKPLRFTLTVVAVFNTKLFGEIVLAKPYGHTDAIIRATNDNGVGK